MNPPRKSHVSEDFGADHTGGIKASAAPKVFVVSLHDVEPRFVEELERIVDGLRTRVGRALSAAVVSAAVHRCGDNHFTAWVREHFQEIALHGYTHQSRLWWHPVSVLTGGANEFSGLSEEESREKLALGQEALSKLFGEPAKVFVPPAWCCGAAAGKPAAEVGLSMIATLRHLVPINSRVAGCQPSIQQVNRPRDLRIPLQTFSWDCGRIAALGFAGEWLGRLLSGVPCVTFHPADVRRGFFQRGLKLVDQLLERGSEPVTFEGCAKHVFSQP